MTNKSTQTIAYSSILVAFGILIPMIMPVKIIIGPASYTLASHVPLFLAIFISPAVAIFVSLGTTLGFFLAGFPFVIVLRAFSQIFFTLIAAFYIRNHQSQISSPINALPFALFINIIHGLGEFLVVLLFTSGQSPDVGYIWSIFSLVGLGTIVHGLVDFYLALSLWNIILTRIGLNIKPL
ncbi:Niacin transporter NiaX [Streptococcus parauberis]|uniref:Niacin transporter NiaX n=1 Tax=Streptococcus parauberis TaxID=1348 RepID=A0A854WQF9_9STRE|nr:hypothetical protein [Streptococcus parauberis]PCH12706.1 Niacin transporter NiaX [Streptococcus parauberis]